MDRSEAARQTPCGEAADTQGGVQKTFGTFTERCPAFECRIMECGIARHATLHRTVACHPDSCGHRGTGFAGLATEQSIGVGTTHVEAQVEAIEQRAGETTPIAGTFPVVAATCARATGFPTRAGVHRGHEQHLGGQHHRRRSPRDANRAVFEWLTQSVEDMGRELAELVEEQHPVGGT